MNPPADTLTPNARPSDATWSYVRVDDFTPADLEDWRRLASRRTESAPFVDETWMRAWIAAFAPADHVCLCLRREGRLVGLAFMTPVNERWAGKTIDLLESATNAWSYRFEFLALDDDREIYSALWRTLFTHRRWDVVRLSWVVDRTPTMEWGLRTAKELGWSSAVVEAGTSPWRRLPEPGQPWDKGLRSKFKSNLRNRERRLQALGEVTFTVVKDAGGLEQAIRIFYDIEAKSWKGEKGTAIVMQEKARALFDGLIRAAPPDVWIPILSVDGRPVAAQFMRVQNRTMFLLKTSYDPEFSAYSPGQLITARAVRHGIENGVDALDFLGVSMAWKSDWMTEERPNVQLIFCAPSASGRYAYWTRYGLKNEVKKIPFAVLLARRLRRLRRRS